MDVFAIAVIAVILGSILYSAWREMSMSVIASIACVFTLTVLIVNSGSFTSSELFHELAFRPHDLVDPGRLYTLLTSMYTHAGLTHLIVNVLALVLLGVVFEQRIGTRPFIVLYLLSGLAGTLVFALLRWNDPLVYVVGASGAISGILGGFARLYPSERVMILLLPPMPAWIAVVAFVLIQILLIPSSSGIAFEAHLGGLAAGVLLAPLVVRLPLRGRRAVVKPVQPSLKRLATTPELRSMLQRIESETVPDVKRAWTDHFIATARCPYCGSSLKLRGSSIICEKGHLL